MNAALQYDEKIFGELVRFYGETFNLPPLSAKIYAYLFFDFERKGICFDAFVQVFAASKSSVSSNLNLLLNAKLIRDFNTINERRRFFAINDDFITIRFSEIVDKMKQELLILDQVHRFRKNTTDCEEARFEIYKELLTKNIHNIEETLHKI